MLKINYLSRACEVENCLNGFQMLKMLAPNKAKGCVALKFNGKIIDLSTAVDADGDVDFITEDTAEGLEIIRHSAAHLLAYAARELWKGVKLAIGPAIENGFYYDFDVESPFQESDLAAIENKMIELRKRDEKFTREVMTRVDAVKLFKSLGEDYKLELIGDLPVGDPITIYRLGSFIDLCRGPHVPSAGYLKHFKLTKIAGAYWRGDSRNKMLQRIYGIAFDSGEKMAEYLDFLREAEKRDHRKICKTMDLLHFEPEFAPGAPFFHSKGLFVYNKLIDYMRQKQDGDGYIEVMTPRVMNRNLWEISGHWEKYGEHNYSGKTEDEKQFCIKPMNCPGAILIYKQGIKSYRDLPLKISEFGKVNRYEASGAIAGLLRAREFTQDDAHVFCAEEQMGDECKKLVKFVLDTYKDLGFDAKNVKIKLSTRPEKRIGSDNVWDLSEGALINTLNDMELPFTIFEGEGAFYGPKLEFVLKDCMGRDWQMGTIQLDMNLPDRFDINYIERDGQKRRPIMFHRAILGSIERFMGIFIEHTDGKFPLWLNPLQIMIATISEESNDYALSLRERLEAEGLRVALDISGEKIAHKVREASLQKIPYIFAVGKNEKDDDAVTVRILGEEKTGKKFLVEDAIKKIGLKIRLREKDFTLK
ncbi:MAG: threonine--tRNA ligase [Rickettsiales bacterium]|jgi:threonyl-tRNA synthetase|nr:threonine--tRNA ligase [Rickettsiales bacterium]